MRMLRVNWGTIGTIGESAIASLSRLPFTWRGLGALILGVLLAKWFWILFAPHATFTAAMPERSAGLEAGSLFGVVAESVQTAEGVALPNVQLLGVFAASTGKKGFAVLKFDNRQKGVAEGEEVSAGTRLVAVHADYVLLERGGAQQRVNLENKNVAATSKTTTTTPALATTENKQIKNAAETVMETSMKQLRR
jgi:type II secretory pathway component PulC